MAISVLIIALVNIVLVNTADDLLVNIEQGTVKGYKMSSDYVFEFHGIPFATAPTGTDRFQPPLPPPIFDGIFEATEVNIMCPQVMPGLGPILDREDCLVINVFKPDNNRDNNPVVVYIHGGSFAVGYGNSLVPRTLAEEDIITVTFNYRLGPHGFLCLHTERVPGNAGLRDQLEALRWVQNNIANFGGNPEDVTIAGYSAGAAAAEQLMLSPTTRGLFHRVILESGNGAAFWSVHEDPVEFARNYANLFHVPNVDSTEALTDFYTSLSLNELFSHVTPGVAEFVPCIEKYVGVENVISEHPLHTLQNNTYIKLSVLSGFTDAEGQLFEPNKELWMKEMNENFSDHLPPANYQSEKQKQEIAALVREFYFGNTEINSDKYLNYVDYLTDVFFSYPIIVSARLHTTNTAPVYLYEFNYVDSQELYGTLGIGADHCAQTVHVLDHNFLLPVIPTNSSNDDVWMERKTVELWSNFIKYGHPWPEHWSPTNLVDLHYLSMNLGMNTGTWPMKERIQFWDEIFEKIDANSARRIHLNIALYITIFTVFLNNWLYVSNV